MRKKFFGGLTSLRREGDHLLIFINLEIVLSVEFIKTRMKSVGWWRVLDATPERLFTVR